MARSKFERRAHKRLLQEGWQVDYKMRPQFGSSKYNTDFFNLFDLIAYKIGEPLRFISVKGAGVPSEHRKALERFAPESEVWIEVWSYRKLKSRDSRKFYVKAEWWDENVRKWKRLWDEEALSEAEMSEILL